MAFVELQPSTSQLNGIGTGVRVSVSGRNGLRISVADEALAILGGGGEAHRYKVLIDRDPAFPRLRVVLAPDGGFKQSKPPLGDRWKMIRVGRDTGLPEIKLPATECEWEKVEGQPTIEIELPRELRPTRQHQPVGQPSTSTQGRPATVTLPGALPGRVKERA